MLVLLKCVTLHAKTLLEPLPHALSGEIVGAHLSDDLCHLLLVEWETHLGSPGTWRYKRDDEVRKPDLVCFSQLYPALPVHMSFYARQIPFMLVAAGALLFASSTMPALAPSFTMARVPTSSTRLNELETAVASLDAQVRQLLGSLPPTTPNSGTALKSAPAAAPVQAATASATPKAMTSLERAVAAAAVPTNSSTTSLPAAPVDVVPWTTLANASCNAKLHAGYGGGAFTWGMTFKVSSAQECCDACTAHARTCVDQISVGQPYYERRWQGNTTVERCPSHMSSNEEGTHKAAPCNIWVFCPTLWEDGGLCWSNDVWNHSYGEVRAASNPRLRSSLRLGVLSSPRPPPAACSVGSRTSRSQSGLGPVRMAPILQAIGRNTKPPRRRFSGCRAA